MRQNLAGDWTEVAQRDLVVSIGRPCKGIMNLSGDGGEISGSLGVRGHKLDVATHTLCQGCPLIRPENEELVLADRPSRRNAELIASDVVLIGGKVVAAVQGAIAHKLEEISMELIGARFSHNIDRAPWRGDIFGPIAVGHHPEFLHRIGIGEWTTGNRVRVHIVGPIQRKVDPTGPNPIDGRNKRALLLDRTTYAGGVG